MSGLKLYYLYSDAQNYKLKIIGKIISLFFFDLLPAKAENVQYYYEIVRLLPQKSCQT